MNYRTIPGADLKPYSICLGTSNMGATIDRQTTFAMLDAYLDHGGNFLDTASVYANWIPGLKNSSEKILGEWMAARGNRNRVIVATKGGHPDLATMHISRLSRADIVSDLEASLRNLRTNVIDLYYLHRDDPRRSVEEIMETLNEQVRAGQVRYLGCSNWRLARIRAAQTYAAAHGMRGFVANQMLWNLAHIEPDQIGDKTIVPMSRELDAYHRETGLAAIPYSSQANGLFQKLEQGRLDRTNLGGLRMYNIEKNNQRLERIRKIRAESGLTLTQIVLGYLISQPFVTIPVVGCKTVEQLADSLQAAEVRLTLEQVACLNA